MEESGNITGHLISTNLQSISDSCWWFRGFVAAKIFSSPAAKVGISGSSIHEY